MSARLTDLHVGFTGTQLGMTLRQAGAVRNLLAEWNYSWLHHGDCVGADELCHGMAIDFGMHVAIHPPLSPAKQAFCRGDEEYSPKPYLVRNRDIVSMTSRLLAAPKGMEEELRSGTWSTVRFARRAGRPVTIVFPDGSARNE